jgi:hypothetical protein
VSAAAPAPVPVLHRWLVGALFLALAASYPYAMLVVDSGRDLAMAQAIASGDAWPAYGPSLNATWSLGPVWFYLLALPFAAGAGVGVVAFAIGLLGAAKVPLAYALGRRWQDPALGLAGAAAIALPGWSTFGQLVLLHTSAVETGVLATLLLALRGWQQTRARDALLASLSLALALHAHPTALVAAPAVALALWRVARGERRVWLLAPLLFLLPFLPMLLAEARAGWPQWQATLGYAGGSDFVARLARAPALLRGLGWGGTEFVRDLLLARWPAVAFGYAGTLAILLLLAGGGLLSGLRRGALALPLGLSGVAFLLVLLLRDSTPEWMTYALAPFGAILLALGLLAPWTPPRRAGLALGLAAFALGSSLAVLRDRQLSAADGWQAMPGDAIADVARPPRRDDTPRFWLPAWGHDVLAQALCSEASPPALHGDLATALHFGQGVALRRHCRADAAPRLGGEAQRAYAGVPLALARELALAGTTTSYGFLLGTNVTALHPARGAPMQAHTRYLLDDYLPRLRAGERHRVALRGTCGAGDLLVATNLVPLLNEPFVLRDARGAAPAPRARSIASSYYACPPDGRIEWTLEVLDPAAADVFVWRAG